MDKFFINCYHNTINDQSSISNTLEFFVLLKKKSSISVKYLEEIETRFIYDHSSSLVSLVGNFWCSTSIVYDQFKMFFCYPQLKMTSAFDKWEPIYKSSGNNIPKKKERKKKNIRERMQFWRSQTWTIRPRNHTLHQFTIDDLNSCRGPSNNGFCF